jgi:predicted porin
MKKLLIASAALAMVAGTAQAQSSVSVYGSIDASYGNVESKSNINGFTTKDTASSLAGASAGGSLTSSRLGFRGTEDLGGGLAANFNLEYALDNGTGTTTVNNIRTSTVGLSSKSWGSFNIGRQLTGIHNVLTATSPIAANNMAGDIQYSNNAVADGAMVEAVGFRMHEGIGLSAVRTNNSISYVTPSFSGFTARVDYARDVAKINDVDTVTNEFAAGTAKVEMTGLSGTYNQGPLLVTAGTHTIKGVAQATTNIVGDDTFSADTKFTVDAIAARYTIGATKLNAIYSKKKQSVSDTDAGTFGNLFKTDAMQVGVSHDIGKVTLAAQYGENSTKFGEGANNANGGKVDGKAYQLAAIYNLSKRTNVYAAYGSEERKVKTVGVDTGTVGDKVERTQYAVGLRHSF